MEIGTQAVADDRNKGAHGTETNENYTFALVILTSLFFMWGFISALNDVLIPHLKAAFSLNYTQAILVQFCFFAAYFIVSIPAGQLVKRLGYQKGIVFGLLVAAAGCFLFYPAAVSQAYAVFLGALFVMASGITVLQVSANPYVAHLGRPETASSRLTLTQAFNSLGTTVSPFFGAALILSAAALGADAVRGDASSAATVKLPYLMIAGTLVLLALAFSRLNLPRIDAPEPTDAQIASAGRSVIEKRHLRLGAIGIFLYVGAEVSIGSFIVNFLGLEHVAGMGEAEAARYLPYYWGGAMVGRFIGALAMRIVSPGKLLTLNATMSVALLVSVSTTSGDVAMWSVLLIGLCNSIMFPTIFSLAIAELGPQSSQGSGILCLAIVGGAIIPLLQGVLADLVGLQLSFLLPIVCYVFIAHYGIAGSRIKE